MSRTSRVAQLAVPTARSMRWAPVAGSSAVAVAAVVLMTQTRLASGPYEPGVDHRVAALRMGAVLVCLGAAFLLDDPSGDTTAPAPTPHLERRAIRVGLALLALAPPWGLLTVVARLGMREPGGVPVLAVSLEALALLVVTLAVAAVADRFVPERLGGLVAGPVLLVLIALAFAAPVLPGHLRPFPSAPGGPEWGNAHALWARLLAGATAVLLGCSLGPGRTRLRALIGARSA